MSDVPNHPNQSVKPSGTSSSGSNAAQPYMTDAVIAGGTKAATDQSAIDKDMYDENGDPLFTDDYNLAQEHRDREGKGQGRAPDTDLEYQQGGDTSDETGSPIPTDAKASEDQSQPLDERLSGNQR